MMAVQLHHRKILISEPDKNPKFTQKFAQTDCYLCYICPENCYQSPPPPQLIPPPPPPLQFSDPNPIKNHVPTVLILMLCVLGVAFLVLSYLTLARYRRRRNPTPPEASRTNFADENQGPIVDHPIWYIRTVGLPQSAIDAIALLAYKKGDGVVDSNDCAVCLSEFREGEAVRLLPKCTHAFHRDCIDTWLRSHKNCPVCRAPVLAPVPPAGPNARVTSRVGSSSSSAGSSPAQLGDEDEDEEEGEAKNARIRRSVSMDLSCASNSSIYRVMKRSLSFSGKRSLRKNGDGIGIDGSSSQESFQLQEMNHGR